MPRIPKTKVCELWRSPSNGSHTFFPEDNAQARTTLEPDAVLQWKVTAASWKDACARMHEYLGYEPYRPEPGERDDWAESPSPAARLGTPGPGWDSEELQRMWSPIRAALKSGHRRSAWKELLEQWKIEFLFLALMLALIFLWVRVAPYLK